jgi:deoxyribonuclease-4
MLLGAHLSIAGGLHKALDRARGFGFDCVGLFVRNQIQWRRPPLCAEAVRVFRRTRRRLRMRCVVAHASYLVNLAGRAAVRRKSIAAMREDLRRCDRLGAEYLVLHPGSREDAAEGIRLIAAALTQIATADRPPGCRGRRPKILLETTAGQGSSIAHTFEQLAEILSALPRRGPFGVCLDTCHVFAAGYDIRTSAAYHRTLADLDRTVGLDRLLAVHLNDSRRELGSRVDRHEHIGRGRIGLEGFAHFVNDPRLADVPMILETPKGTDDSGRDWDEINAEVLRGLCRRR